MADYISRDDALDAILSEYPDAHYPSFFADKIKKIPAADVIEVVRCEDCSWNDAKKGKVSCHCYAALIESGPEDYCSLGRRRENDG